ncbi:MAG: DUF1122 family protein, partial [Chloroflexota bacterium]
MTLEGPAVTLIDVDSLTPAAHARIEEALAARGWELPGDHPISHFDGLPLGEYRIHALLGPKNKVGSRWFRLFLADTDGNLADEQMALGLFGAGPYPAFNWLEFTQFEEILHFTDAQSVDLWQTGLERPLFEAMSSLIPPGGHLMAEYDSPSHKATERILTLRYPPAASPIGYLMFQAGVRSYRDWYISEGGREGPRKLQGFKPLNEDIRVEKTALLRADMERTMASEPNPAHAEWGELARDLA